MALILTTVLVLGGVEPTGLHALTSKELTAKIDQVFKSMERASRAKDDADWLKEWSGFFAICRRLTIHDGLEDTIARVETKLKTAPANGVRALDAIWARAFVACAARKFNVLKTLMPRFEAAVKAAGTTTGEIVGDLEMCRAMLLAQAGKRAETVPPCRKALEAYRAVGATTSRQYLFCLEVLATAEREPKSALDLWSEYVDVVERIYEGDFKNSAVPLTRAYRAMQPPLARLRRMSRIVYVADRLVELADLAEPDQRRRSAFLGGVYNDRGNALHGIGDNSSAVDSFLAAAVCYKEADLPEPGRYASIAMVSNNLGNALRDLGRFKESEEAYRNARELSDKHFPNDHRMGAMHHANWGRSLSRLGKLDDAEKAFAAARKHMEAGGKSYLPILDVDLGELALRRGDLDAARRHAKEFMKRGRQTGWYNDEAPHLVGRIEQTAGNLKEARRAFEHRFRYQVTRARTQAPSLAEVRLLEYANRPEATSPVNLLSVLKPGDPADDRQAYDAVWKAREVAVSVSMQRRRATGPAVDSARLALDHKRQWLSAAVNKQDLDRRSALRLEVEARDKESLEERWAEAAAKTPIVWREPADLAKRLPDGVALVEYLRVRIPRPSSEKKGAWTVDDVYEAYVVRRKNDREPSVARRSLGPAEPIDKAALAFRNVVEPSFPVSYLGNAPEKPATDGGKRLKELVVDPLAADLAGASTVIIAPDGLLHQVPWCALPGKRPKEFWIDDVLIGATSSGPELMELLSLKPVPDERTAMLVGGVTFQKSGGLFELLFGGGDRITDLPATLAEVHEIAELLAGWKVDLETGAAPDEPRMRERLGRSRWVHFSTHGFFVPMVETRRGGGLFADDPPSREARADLASRHPLLFCGLVCAKAGETTVRLDGRRPPIDNLLTADEISGLRLENTEMVVLSACGTAQGIVEFGDGSASLARAFHLAGARSVVASRWPIGEASSALFAKRYFHNLLAGKSKVAALADAQRWLRTEHPEWSAPTHWASFLLSGDWR
jgi:CHAT domain-containing protein/tetratricopeptide (TPR) repeat protein